MKMPMNGRKHNEILTEMRSFGRDDANYKEGRTWSLVYYLGKEHTDFLKEAFGTYFSENALNPMAFNSLKRFEAEVVRMTASMLHGGPKVCGTMTSGGTESCLLAVKTYRDRARRLRRVRRPEMVVPESIHVAFEKAAEYFGVKAVHAPVDKTFRVDVKRVRRLINRNTVMIVGSAPCYPHGVVDPIEELGELALSKGVPLHVDACLGGFLLPFVDKLGLTVPPFDFRVPGVCSMTADVHKYGYAAKGASVILYRTSDYLRDQLFVYENWPGGIFASPALLGTRPGGAIAAAWASMQAMGESGYLEQARLIMDTTHTLVNGINTIPGLEVLGNPHMSVLAYRSVDPDVSIYAVGDRMEERGWHIDRQQRPECLHAMVTPGHADVIQQYLADLADTVARVRRNPEASLAGGAAMYGMISRIPLRRMVRRNVLKMMLELYGPEGKSPSLDAPPDDLANRAGMAFLRLTDRLSKWRR